MLNLSSHRSAKKNLLAAILYSVRFAFPSWSPLTAGGLLVFFLLLCSPTLNNSNWALSIRSNYVLPARRGGLVEWRVLVSIRRKFLIMRAEPLFGGGFTFACVCVLLYVNVYLHACLRVWVTLLLRWAHESERDGWQCALLKVQLTNSVTRRK